MGRCPEPKFDEKCVAPLLYYCKISGLMGDLCGDDVHTYWDFGSFWDPEPESRFLVTKIALVLCEMT